MADGRGTRPITNRSVTFGKVWWDSHSLDDSLSPLKIMINEGSKKRSGALLRACQSKSTNSVSIFGIPGTSPTSCNEDN